LPEWLQVPHDAWPVYAADLRTLIGYMVRGKGFIPLGVDPATVQQRPVHQGASPAPPETGPNALTVYLRNATAETVWLATMVDGTVAGAPKRFGNGVAVSCIVLGDERRLVLFNQSPLEQPSATGREIHMADAPASGAVWIDVDRSGLFEGQGVPAWWPGGAQGC
jgi:hypothetical protein